MTTITIKTIFKVPNKKPELTLNKRLLIGENIKNYGRQIIGINKLSKIRIIYFIVNIVSKKLYTNILFDLIGIDRWIDLKFKLIKLLLYPK